MAVEYDWAGAETEYKRSIELDPASWPYHSRAKVLWYQGRHDEAMAQVKRSLDLDPTDFWANDSMGAALYWAHRYDEAINQFKKMLEMDPNNAGTHGDLGIAYRQKRMYPEAIAELQRGIDLLGDDEPAGISYLGEVYAASGNRGDANKALAQLKEQSKHRYVDPYDIARIYIGLAEKDLAFQELEKGYEDRSFSMLSLKVDPLLDPIRSDSRFKDLLARVGLDK
jgi:tetratricopeptide (TPR) repeat protein